MATRMAVGDYKKLLIRMPPPLYRYLDALSDEKYCSVNATLVDIVRQWAEAHPLEERRLLQQEHTRNATSG